MSTKHILTALCCASTALSIGCVTPDDGDSGSTTIPTTIGSGSATQGTTTTASTSGMSGTSSGGADGTSTSQEDSTGDGAIFDVAGARDMGPPIDPGDPILWYSVDDRLIYIELDPADGSVVQLVEHQITNQPPLAPQGTGITMLDDGGLLIARGPVAVAGGNYPPEPSLIYYAPQPPTAVAGAVELQLLGPLPDNVAVEGLHVDCQGLVYLMDSGTNSATAEGNRLLRFTGDFLAGDLSYEVITDLSMASVADIDDMSPGIDAMGEITDSQGFAIDSGTVYDFDYLSGTGVALGMAGTYGIHALGGALFDDDTARLYVLNIDAELFEVDPVTLASSGVLATGPDVPTLPTNGNTGLAGPLTACESGFPPPG